MSMKRRCSLYDQRITVTASFFHLKPQRYKASDRMSPGNGFIRGCSDPCINCSQFGRVPSFANLSALPVAGRPRGFLVTSFIDLPMNLGDAKRRVRSDL